MWFIEEEFITIQIPEICNHENDNVFCIGSFSFSYGNFSIRRNKDHNHSFNRTHNCILSRRPRPTRNLTVTHVLGVL